MRYLAILFLWCSTVELAFSQMDNDASPFRVSGYIDVYYGYDFNQPENNSRPSFMYSYNRHNEVNINLGFIKASYITNRVRASLALMGGTYANANLAAEPGVLKNIYEASAGVKISADRNLWLDAGIFGSHIGFESAIGKDCWTLTRSILADNTPYYEAGARISYTTDNGKWLFSGLLLNGWQRIQRVDGNSLPSFGTQITFNPARKITINSSSFVGTDKPDSSRQMRYFHNLYGIFQLTDRLGVTGGFDCGMEERDPKSSAMNAWFSPVIVIRFALTERIHLAVRGEYYQDEHGVIVTTSTVNGFQTVGFSANVDYRILPNAIWRMEARTFYSKDAVFSKLDISTESSTFLTTSLAVSF